KARADGLEGDQLFLAAQDDPADADELGPLERLSDYAEALARRRPIRSDVIRRVQQQRVQFRRTNELDQFQCACGLQTDLFQIGFVHRDEFVGAVLKPLDDVLPSDLAMDWAHELLAQSVMTV